MRIYLEQSKQLYHIAIQLLINGQQLVNFALFSTTDARRVGMKLWRFRIYSAVIPFQADMMASCSKNTSLYWRPLLSTFLTSISQTSSIIFKSLSLVGQSNTSKPNACNHSFLYIDQCTWALCFCKIQSFPKFIPLLSTEQRCKTLQ